MKIFFLFLVSSFTVSVILAKPSKLLELPPGGLDEANDNENNNVESGNWGENIESGSWGQNIVVIPDWPNDYDQDEYGFPYRFYPCKTTEGTNGTCQRQSTCKAASNAGTKFASCPKQSRLICCPFQPSPSTETPKQPLGKAEDCGKFSNEQIVGGQETTPHSYPWQIALYQYGQFICGGSLIDNVHVATAAHCVVRNYGTEPASSFKVKVGAHDLYTSGTFYTVSKVSAHEKYKPWKTSNDIAVIRLSKPVQFNDNVKPVCLPPENHSIDEGTNLVVTGWGTTSFGGSLARTLQEVTVKAVPNDKCRNNYSVLNQGFFSDVPRTQNSFLCAGDSRGGKDSCQGDSGGPLVQISNGRAYLVGIVSFGYRCAEPNFPGVYTRTSWFLNWLSTHL